MTQLTKRRNGNSGLFPSLNDFFANRLFTPPLFDPDDDLFSTDMGGPPVNISETDKEFKLDLSVPGMNKEDFKVDIENGILTISSEKEEEKEKEGRKKLYPQGVFVQQFFPQFYLTG
ncbi:Hsp20/alpha crystallin family protein [Sinomicrobium pectinilyticum]|uniref:Hsp20/alpha crystallin family protein n=1 Tax=Sinomicrobium pectinilyticum TaxID=1084421 RepID=UPI001F0C4B7C|nr:Hsp20 family protein [Sinomicrobium pectinilyticum]